MTKHGQRVLDEWGVGVDEVAAVLSEPERDALVTALDLDDRTQLRVAAAAETLVPSAPRAILVLDPGAKDLPAKPTRPPWSELDATLRAAGWERPDYWDNYTRIVSREQLRERSVRNNQTRHNPRDRAAIGSSRRPANRMPCSTLVVPHRTVQRLEQLGYSDVWSALTPDVAVVLDTALQQGLSSRVTYFTNHGQRYLTVKLRGVSGQLSEKLQRTPGWYYFQASDGTVRDEFSTHVSLDNQPRRNPDAPKDPPPIEVSPAAAKLLSNAGIASPLSLLTSAEAVALDLALEQGARGFVDRDSIHGHTMTIHAAAAGETAAEAEAPLKPLRGVGRWDLDQARRRGGEGGPLIALATIETLVYRGAEELVEPPRRASQPRAKPRKNPGGQIYLHSVDVKRLAQVGLTGAKLLDALPPRQLAAVMEALHAGADGVIAAIPKRDGRGVEVSLTLLSHGAAADRAVSRLGAMAHWDFQPRDSRARFAYYQSARRAWHFAVPEGVARDNPRRRRPRR